MDPLQKVASCTDAKPSPALGTHPLSFIRPGHAGEPAGGCGGHRGSGAPGRGRDLEISRVIRHVSEALGFGREGCGGPRARQPKRTVAEPAPAIARSLRRLEPWRGTGEAGVATPFNPSALDVCVWDSCRCVSLRVFALPLFLPSRRLFRRKEEEDKKKKIVQVI